MKREIVSFMGIPTESLSGLELEELKKVKPIAIYGRIEKITVKGHPDIILESA